MFGLTGRRDALALAACSAASVSSPATLSCDSTNSSIAPGDGGALPLPTFGVQIYNDDVAYECHWGTGHRIPLLLHVARGGNQRGFAARYYLKLWNTETSYSLRDPCSPMKPPLMAMARSSLNLPATRALKTSRAEASTRLIC